METSISKTPARDPHQLSASQQQQAYLLVVNRTMLQTLRLGWSSLLVMIAAEVKFSTIERGQLLSAFSLGYILTPVLGGLLSDRAGGKHVQTIALFAVGLGTFLIPVLSHSVSRLWWLNLLMGMAAGPQQSGYATMCSAWFEPPPMSQVSGLSDLGTTSGELLATALVPFIAVNIGWAPTLKLLGISSMVWAAACWPLLACASPTGDASTSSHGRQAIDPNRLQASDPIWKASQQQQGQLPQTMASKSRYVKYFQHRSVYSVWLQHMCFNGSKYFITAWVPVFYVSHLSVSPAEVAAYMFPVQLTGVMSSIGFRWISSRIYGASSQDVLRSRKFFATVAFASAAIAFLGMGTLVTDPANEMVSTLAGNCSQHEWSQHHSSNQTQTGPMPAKLLLSPALLGVLFLALNDAGQAAQAFGHKPNYNDLTTCDAGFLTGVGNTLGTLMSFCAPLLAAHGLHAGVGWRLLFHAGCGLNLIGLFIGVGMMGCTKLDGHGTAMKAA